MMYSPGRQETLFSSIAEMEGVFSLAAESQLAENSRQRSKRKNRHVCNGPAALKSQTTQWDSWQASGGTAAGPTVYLYDGMNLLEEVDNSGNVLARYTASRRVDEPLAELRSGTTSYYEADGLGSITSLTSSSGTIANTYTYDSFGNLSASTGSITNPFRYTAREFDSETGNYFYRARYYDANTGRFLSEDPIRFRAGINFYPYVLNNPNRWRDPSGKNAAAITIPVAGGICFASGVCETVIVVGGAVAVVAGAAYLIYHYSHDDSDKPQEKTKCDKNDDLCYQLYLAETAECGSLYTDDEAYETCMEIAWLNYKRCKDKLPPIRVK